MDAYLEKAFIVPDSPKQARKEFYELARSRTKILGPWEFKLFQMGLSGNDRPKDLAQFVIRGPYDSEVPKRRLTVLSIAINENAFTINGEYTDLIPYSIEHEIYEAWLALDKGWGLNNKERHLLARRKQYEIAMRDGKAERLLGFQNKNDIALKDEYDYSYQKALQKYKLTKDKIKERK